MKYGHVIKNPNCSGSHRSNSGLELQKIKININLWGRIKKTGDLTTLYLIISARDVSTRNVI